MRIEKMKIKNYKSFLNYTLEFNDDINILVGDNETGKSTILECIDLIATGSNKKFESIGLNNILNIEEVNKYLALPIENRTIENLPIVVVELYLNIDDKIEQLYYEGKNNSEGVNCCGIRLTCKPNYEYFEEINRIIQEDKVYFPYEYYTYIFDTFAAHPYSKKKNKLKSMWINTLNMYSNYAISDYIKKIYSNYTENELEMRLKFVNRINSKKSSYNDEIMTELNDKLPNDVKGLDNFLDVCVVLNKTSFEAKDDFSLLNNITKNKLYVAITRARRLVYFINEKIVRKYKK